MRSETRLASKWATDVEIGAMATFLKTPIAVFSPWGTTWNWQTFKPNPLMADEPFKDNLVYLSNANRVHYEPVISIDQQ